MGIGIITIGQGLLTIENYKNKHNIRLLIISIFVSIIISLYTFAGGAGVRSVDNEFTFIVWNFFLGGWPTVSYVYLRKKKSIIHIKINTIHLHNNCLFHVYNSLYNNPMEHEISTYCLCCIN